MERAQFLCNECGKDFLDAVKLGLHQYAVHTDKPFECAQCGEMGSGVQKFQNHMRKHKTQKIVSKCELCEFETPHAGQRENREANSVQPVWKNLANKRQAYPTREKPPFECRGAADLLL